ncbi:GATA zinc finger domain-containing protein 1-like [Aphis craccivora]|uniref:GATA zinc finger domain-containing protein 1-like n=1 Tax=Aphis craccivora TaxID=307492 RepID=A0A6G0YJ36_APHCR|nr:GATA zinc finger domain-containing protein 1-like [Aphis craccivora]
MDKLWTVGDIESLINNSRHSTSKIIIYAQIIKLHENNLGEKRANIIWLPPKANIGVTDNSKKVHFDNFKPHEFANMRD